MRNASMAFLLATTLLLAGCTLPWESGEADEEVAGDYENGIGGALAVTNEATKPVNVTVRLLRGGTEVGRDSVTIEPGKTIVRQYAIGQHAALRAQLMYSFDQGGRAASGEDTRDVETVGCEGLTRVSWRVLDFEDGIGSQYLGARCVTDEG